MWLWGPSTIDQNWRHTCDLNLTWSEGLLCAAIFLVCELENYILPPHRRSQKMPSFQTYYFRHSRLALGILLEMPWHLH